MINTYNKIITYEGDSFKDYLNKIHILTIFKFLFEKYQEDDAIKIVKYVMYAYTKESSELIEFETFDKTSKRIFEKVGLSDDFRGWIQNLECEALQLCIEGWLQFQNDEYFTQWITYRDLRKQFLSLSIKDMKKNTGETDIEAKMKAATYANELMVRMQELKQSFVENSDTLKTPVTAFRQAKTRQQMSNRPSATDLVKDAQSGDD